MKKLLFRAPVQTASGYGVHSRMLLRALDKSGKFDITVMSVPWGATPLIYDDTPEMIRVKELAAKFQQNMKPDDFDVSVQVTIPNEFARLAKVNIGVTAGIEVDRVSAAWIKKVNETVDLLVVPSRHSYDTFRQTVHRVTDPQQAQRLGVQVGTELALQRPMMIIPEWADPTVYNTEPVLDWPLSFNLDDMPEFNYLVVGLGMDKADGEDRKNITNLVKWFCEQFKNDPRIGLVLKVSMVNYSPVDFKNISARIKWIKQATGCGQFPKIKLVHGRLSDKDMASLYKHPKIKALVTTTHGEGFGLPIIEAAACALPVIAVDWSGQRDFLYGRDGKRLFVSLDYEIKEIPPSNVWQDVMDQGSKYAYPFEMDVKGKLAKVFMSYEKPKAWAEQLAKEIPERFNEHCVDKFIQDLEDVLEGKSVSIPLLPLGDVGPAPADEPGLDKVTLVAVATNRPYGTASALAASLDQLPGIKKAKFFTTPLPDDLKKRLPEKIEVIDIPVFYGTDGYDDFVLKELPKYIDTEYVMIVQQDGYVLNGKAWSEDFLKYDWIGAPWFWDGVVGNGGFNIRSKRIMDELAKPEYADIHPEDDKVCRVYGPQLRAKGFTFAPIDVAERFSVENQGIDMKARYKGQLGWHGRTPFYGVYIPN